MAGKKGGAFTVAGKTYPSQYAYRKALAQSKGYSNRAAYQADVKVAHSLAKLSKPERRAYDRALDALNLVRKRGLSLSQAAQMAGTSPKVVLKHAGSAFERKGSRYVAKANDSLPRFMRVLTPYGPETALVRSSREASLIGDYLNAVKKYLRTGDISVLHPYRNEALHIRGRKETLLTDQSTLDYLSMADELHFDELYDIYQSS